MEVSRRECTSTTPTGIGPTTTRGTSAWSPTRSTGDCTRRRWPITTAANSAGSIWRLSAPRRLSGTPAKKGDGGTSSTAGEAGKAARFSRSVARSARHPSLLAMRAWCGSAPSFAIVATGNGPAAGSKTRPAQSAARRSAPRPGGRPARIPAGRGCGRGTGNRQVVAASGGCSKVAVGAGGEFY